MFCNIMVLDSSVFVIFFKRAVKLHILHVKIIYFYLQCALKMSENASDSDSSCGWTVINHEVFYLKLIKFCQFKTSRMQ